MLLDARVTSILDHRKFQEESVMSKSSVGILISSGELQSCLVDRPSVSLYQTKNTRLPSWSLVV